MAQKIFRPTLLSQNNKFYPSRIIHLSCCSFLAAGLFATAAHAAPPPAQLAWIPPAASGIHGMANALVQPALGPVDQVVEISKGDTLMQMITEAGVSVTEAQGAVDALTKVYSPKSLQIGQQFVLTLSAASDASSVEAGQMHLEAIAFKPDVERNIRLVRTTEGVFTAEVTNVPLTAVAQRHTAQIDSSLFESGQKEGVPQRVLSDMIKAFSYDVDFQRDIQPGDQFEVVYDARKTPDGQIVRTDDFLYGAMVLSGKRVELYRYTDKDGNIDYYNAKGQSVRKALLKTPVDGARITSGFGMRKHPVLGYSKLHKGVDFGAPTGTPVYAAGNGTVVKAGWNNGGYGNYVQIKHNGTYSTAYAHASKIAAGIKPGAKVRQGQVIAYVGSTGRSTGPHLHYEILVNGKAVNPKSIKQLPAGTNLAGKELDRFNAQRKTIDAKRNDLSIQPQLVLTSGSSTVQAAMPGFKPKPAQ